MKELIVALDLELNQPSQRIVQVGAVLGNVRTGGVVSQFDVKVNPGEPLSSRIAELTGISPLEIASAPSLAAAGHALAADRRVAAADGGQQRHLADGGRSDIIRN